MEATRRTTKSCKPTYPVYPAGGKSEDPLYWLACWIRHLVQADAAKKHRFSRSIRRDTPLDGALFEAEYACQQLAKESLQYLHHTGGLLFAWEGTTALTTEGGAV